jgi:ABC-type lipoprotein export system ATPase subunit
MRVAQVDSVSVVNEGGRLVLDGVSFGVQRGEALALCGHSGAGKTTALRLIAGLSQPTVGRVTVLGRKLHHLDYAGQRALHLRVGFVFEATGLWSNRSVYENIALPMLYHPPRPGPSPHERALSLARELAISEWLNQPVARCNASVGKRTLFARALALEPELLLCDEPQHALLPREARLVSRALERRRSERGLTIIHADHDGQLDPYVADRRLYLERGQLLERPSMLPPSDMQPDLGLPDEALRPSQLLGDL